MRSSRLETWRSHKGVRRCRLRCDQRTEALEDKELSGFGLSLTKTMQSCRPGPIYRETVPARTRTDTPDIVRASLAATDTERASLAATWVSEGEEG